MKSAFAIDDTLKKIVLKLAITTNSLTARGVKLDHKVFGNYREDPFAFIAFLVSKYSKNCEHPGFEMLLSDGQAELSHSIYGFSADDFRAALKEIENVSDDIPIETVIERFSVHVRNWTVMEAVKKAYANTLRKTALDEELNIESVVQDISDKAQSAGTDDVKGDFVDALVVSSKNTKGYIKFGIPELDSMTNGARPGEVYLFLGPPKGRKTSFLVHCAVHSLLHNVEARVLFVSYEMTLDAMADRFLNVLRTLALARGYVGNDNIADISAYLGVSGRLYLAEVKPGSTVIQAKTLLKRLHAQGFFPNLVVFDYVVFMSPTVKMAENRHRLAQIARDLVDFSKTYNVTSISAHLLKREAIEKMESGKDLSRVDIAESYEVLAVVDAAIAIQVQKDKNSPFSMPAYKLRVVAARRFQDDTDVGVYRASYDGLSMEQV